MVGLNNTIIRTYREGDEDEIAQLLNECFDSYKSSGLTGEMWLRIFELDLGYRKDLAYLAEKDGKIVSHVQLVVRDLKVGSAATLRVAGIANVSTLRDFRRDGISTKLLGHAIESAKEKGFACTALFTGAQIPAHRIYLKLGLTDVYFQVLLLRGTKAPLEWSTQKPNRTSSEQKVRIRESDEDDDSSILKIYEKNYSSYNGLVVRNMNTWKSKYRKSFFYECPFYEDKPKPSNILVAEGKEGEIIGYAISGLAKRDKLGHICEVLTLPHRELEAGRPLAEHVLSNLASEKPISNMVYSSKGTLIDELFRKGSSPLEGVSVFMYKTMNLKAVLESSFQRNAPDNGKQPRSLWNNKGAIAIMIRDEETVTTKYDGKVISVIEGEESREKVIFADHDAFAKLLFGAFSIGELMKEGKVKLSLLNAKPSGVIKLLDMAYPKKPIHTCPGDLW
jgi:predicted N-acetyltransferase YhbS